jgi:hypothetical protein
LVCYVCMLLLSITMLSNDGKMKILLLYFLGYLLNVGNSIKYICYKLKLICLRVFIDVILLYFTTCFGPFWAILR